MNESTLKKLDGWADRSCLDTDLELWFGPSNDLPPHLREPRDQAAFREQTAKAVCSGCPIRVECLESELARSIYDQHGVRGGMTAGERRELIRQRRKPAAAVVHVGEVA
ncbi:WhiB family transcriptional regulator [Actinosynnema sp. NPDC059797]